MKAGIIILQPEVFDRSLDKSADELRRTDLTIGYFFDLLVKVL